MSGEGMTVPPAKGRLIGLRLAWSRRRRAEFVMAAVFLLILSTVPISQFGLGLVERLGSRAAPGPKRISAPGPGEPADRKREGPVIPRGRDIRAFESRWEESLQMRQWLLLPSKSLLAAVGAGNPQVYPGRSSWLFYRPDVDHLTGPGFLDPKAIRRRRSKGDGQVHPDPIPAILQLRDFVRRQGGELLVLVAPSKASIYPEMLSSRLDEASGPLRNPSFRRFAQRLQEAGVELLDPAPAFWREKVRGRPLYLKTDSHWTPFAVKITARLAARRAQRMLAGREPRGETFSRRLGTIAGRGDLIRMLHPSSKAVRLQTENAHLEQVFDRRGNPWAPDRRSSILLLGDSFSNIYSLKGMGWGESAGLAAQLSFELGRGVDSIAINDGGALSARRELMRRYSRSPQDFEPRSLVIYQFAARELSQGDWRLLPKLVRTDSAVASLTGGPFLATGRIAAASPLPSMQDTPYRDLIRAFHLVDFDPADGRVPAEGIVVYAWAWKDGREAPAAAYRRGQRVSLQLIAWQAVSQGLERFSRAELDDERLWSLKVFWAADAE